MTILFLDACPRGPQRSRTHGLCEAFLSEVTNANPAIAVERAVLREMDLKPLYGEQIDRRDSLINSGQFGDERFAPARQFAEADAVLIGAPYWDLSFPAALKVYLEHIFVRDLCFRYEDDRPVGLCRAKRALYITTAGGPILRPDVGEEYLRAALTMLGIERLDAIGAEMLDVLGVDVRAVLAEAEVRVRAAAKEFAQPE